MSNIGKFPILLIGTCPCANLSRLPLLIGGTNSLYVHIFVYENFVVLKIRVVDCLRQNFDDLKYTHVHNDYVYIIFYLTLAN